MRIKENKYASFVSYLVITQGHEEDTKCADRGVIAGMVFICSVIFALTVMACSPAPAANEMKGGTRTSIHSQEDFGTLPPPPKEFLSEKASLKGSEPSDFEALISADGQPLMAKAVRNTRLAVRKPGYQDTGCTIKKSDLLLLVARVKLASVPYYIAQPFPACENGIQEGYVLETDVDEISNPKPSKIAADTNIRTQTDTGPIIPENTVVSAKTSENIGGCLSVAQISMGPSKQKDLLAGINSQSIATAVAGEGCTTGNAVDPKAASSDIDKLSLCVMPGGTFREPSKSNLALKIKGTATTWQIKVDTSGGVIDAIGTMAGAAESMEPKNLYAAKYLASDGSYQIPFSDFIDTNDWYASGVTFTITGRDSSGQPVGNVCQHDVRLASPLVLDFSKASSLETIQPNDSHVRFDLRGDGKKLHTGWILPTAGFLAIDLNNNGLIDNGKELFGEFTLLSNGHLASNGFSALADYDGRRKGFVDKSDPVFSRLVVWTDINGNGISEK
ncbi:MAG: hypothetical protein HQK54_08345, partial [Oligoflexales bacterium]|nr:hypothetical protein [Oligoflexales bacterium]